MRPEALSRKVTPIDASNAFEDLLGGDPEYTLELVREDYQFVISAFLKQGRRSFWVDYPMEVARCAILGIDPKNGETLTDPDKFVAEYKSNHPADSDTVRRFYIGMKNIPPFILHIDFNFLEW